MKAILFLSLAIGLVPLRGSPAVDPFSFIGPDYKKPQELPENFFNPFKSQASGSDLARKEAVTVSNEAVASAIGHRGISGIVYSPDARADRVVVGDQVFAIGDELSFPDGDKPDGSPLVAGASVILRAVHQENLQFDIVPEGEASRRLVFSLHGFWRK
jgi:hypothetical protein